MITRLFAGTVIGYAGASLYDKLYPQPTITSHQKSLISSYINDKNLTVSFSTIAHKMYQFFYETLYYHGLMNTLEAYNFHQLYYVKDQLYSPSPEEIKHIYCIFNPKDILCSFQNSIHGGIMAIIADNSLVNLASRFSSNPTATIQLNVQFFTPIHKNIVYSLEGQVKNKEKRKIFLQSNVRNLQTNEIVAKCQATFITVRWGNIGMKIIQFIFGKETKKQVVQ